MSDTISCQAQAASAKPSTTRQPEGARASRDASDSATPPWRASIDTLFAAPELAGRIRALGAQIAADYAGRDLVAIGVLRGSFPFFADLVRAIDLPLSCEFIGLSSYGDAQKSSGRVRNTSELEQDIAGRDVLIVEDIVESGLSMQHLIAQLSERQPRSIAVCTLLHKPAGTRVSVELAYVGFTIEDVFVVGYGLDYKNRLRNLPYVGVVRAGQQPALDAALDEVNHAAS